MFAGLGVAEGRGGERSWWGDGRGERFSIRLGLKFRLSPPCLLQSRLWTRSPRVPLGRSTCGCSSSPMALGGFEPVQFVGSAAQRLLSRGWQMGFPGEKWSLV